MAASFGQVLSSAAGGFLAAVLSWRAIFMLDGVVALGITIAMLRLLRRAPRPVATREPATARFRVVLRDRRHIGFYLLIFVEGSFTLGAFAYFGAMLHDRDGFSFTTIGVIISLFGMASIVAGRLLGRFARRLGERRMILFGGLGTAASYALVVVQPAAVFAPLAMLLLGVAWIVMHSTLQTRATELAPGARATGVALFAFALFLGSSAGALVVALAIDRAGYDATMLGIAAVTAAFTAVATAAIVPWSQPDTLAVASAASSP
jgi:predicted MFS family arabinose efflux permease